MGKFSRKVRRGQEQDQRKADRKKLRNMRREAIISGWKKRLKAKEAPEEGKEKLEEPTEEAT